MSKTAQLSQIAGKIEEYSRLILSGRVVCIDPSAGSGSSMPGYAIYEAGKLIESGLIQIDTTLPLHLRLHELGRTLREEFPAPDILVVEYIGGYAFGPLRYNINAYHSLIKSAGVVVSSFCVDKIIEVPPNVWKKYVDEDYVKSDEADAIYIGSYVIRAALGTLPEPLVFVRKPRKPRVAKSAKKKKKTEKREIKSNATKKTTNRRTKSTKRRN